MTRIVMGARWQALRREQDLRWLERRTVERARIREVQARIVVASARPEWRFDPD